MGPVQVEHGSDRHNTRWINRVVGHVIMALDVIEIDGDRDAWLLEEIHEIALQAWIIEDATEAALKVDVVNNVEPNERAKEPPIRLDDPIAEKISAFR